MNTLAPPLHLIDVRRVAPPSRHPVIFSTFDSLPLGESLDLVNDHDPVPLHRQFDIQRNGQFDWRHLQAGPDLWRVRITRIAAAQAGSQPAAGSACGGSCSGH